MKTFNAEDNILPGYFPGILYRLLMTQGIASKDLLENTQFTPETFDSDTIRFNFQQHTKFMLNAIRLTQNPHLGFWFGQRLNITALGLVGLAALSSATVEHALNNIVKFFYLRAPLLQLSLVKNESHCGLAIMENLDLQDIRYFIHSAALSGSYRLLQYYLGPDKLDAQAHFNFAVPDSFAAPGPLNVQELNLDFPCEFSKQQSCLWFPKDILEHPMMMADPQTASSTEELCEQQLAQRQLKVGIVAKVQNFLQTNYEDGPGLKETAAFCHVSERTLRRELTRSNTNFQKIYDNVRHEIAQQLLTTPGSPISNVGYKLGFKDLSSFRRAFKKWSGQTPSEYRDSQLKT